MIAIMIRLRAREVLWIGFGKTHQADLQKIQQADLQKIHQLKELARKEICEQM